MNQRISLFRQGFVRPLSVAVLLAATPVALAETPAVAALLKSYEQAGAGPFSANAGEAFWYRDWDGRQCASCHASDPHLPGQHIRTHRAIAPMAPSSQTDRLSDRQKIEKWLKRNCRWTLGRECSAQEKGDVLSWLSTQ